MRRARNGSVLIVVAGLAAIFAALTVAFLARMRTDAQDAAAFNADIQSRLMLAGALQYVSEGGRIGWGQESFGWRDIRDGVPGPRDMFGRKLFVGDATTGVGTDYPAVGGVARCPMYRMQRPPYAVAQNLVVNPIPLEPTWTWDHLISQEHPDPVPAASSYADFVTGDRRPVEGTAPPAWFRVRREDIDTFLITCATGETRGYATYEEALADGAGDTFGSGASFADLRAQEHLMWFRARWSPAVAGNVHLVYLRDGSYELNPISFHLPSWLDSLPQSRQQTGGFSFIQRILEPPSQW